jgi:autoinducer 2-degrading protein
VLWRFALRRRLTDVIKNEARPNGGIDMKRSDYICATIAVVLLGGAAMLQLPGREATAQEGAVYVNAVDLDIKPGDMPKFLEAVKENGANAVKEPGCREFNIQVLAKDPNHVFLYEVYDNEAALTTHRATDHFKKFAAATSDMVAKREVRAMTPIAFNAKGH